MSRRIIAPSWLILGLISLTSCPKPFSPTFCDKPEHVTITQMCYDLRKGLVVQASPVVSSDTSVKLNWTVYILADTSAKAPFFRPALNNVTAGYTVTLPDSLLRDNRKIFVEIRTTCTGVNANKAVGINANAFVKRYNKTSNCYQWGEQPF